MARKLKWKRLKKGRYVSGDFEVKGRGTKWQLLSRSTGEVLSSKPRSKGEAQQLAVSGDYVTEADDDDSSARSSSNATTIDPIVSLRAEVSQLAFAVLGLKAANEQLSESVRLLRKLIRRKL